MTKPLYRLSILLLSLLLVSGCMAKESEMLGGPVEGYNHTSAAINRFTVNGAGGPRIGPYGEGGQVCCGSVPRYWRQGLRAIVEWERDPDPRGYGSWPETPFSDAWNKRMEKHRGNYTRHSVTVEIPQYQEAGTIKVHFLPCNQVRVSANNMFVGDPRYPYNYPRKMEDTECPKP
ncbi:DUF3304 domain-containing protein [Pseudomonas sp. EA_35y_Pfl2_R5]|uniref:DUF3304 domain-containing protein n=1 Tax=Pseudomonas sp. EA_35y_Pfl2_R5 TaxID=3088690 RepID=UPI0030DCDF35